MTGVVNRVSAWLRISPPTIVTPSGWRNSDPVPLPIISGKAPNIAAAVVIMIGRKRRSEAWKIASRSEARGARLNEIIADGNWPRWLIAIGAVCSITWATADNGTWPFTAVEDGR